MRPSTLDVVGAFLLGSFLLGWWLWRIEPTLRSLTLPVDDRPTIVAVFTNEDCVAYGSLVGFLNMASEQDLSVIGVVVDREGSPQEYADPGLSEIVFPLRPDLARQVTRNIVRLGYRTTPVLVLVDRGGRVRRVLPPMPDIIQHSSAIRGMIDDALVLQQSTYE